MTPNLDYTAKELFNKLRTRFSDVKLGDESSNVTKVPSKARFFDFAYNHDDADLGRVTISLEDRNPDEEGSKPSLNVIYGSDLIADLDPTTKNQWYNFLRSLREFARTHWLMFDIRDIEKSQLTKRDYAFLSGSKGEKQMSESKLYGTNRTSWQDIGNAKIVIKHSQPINIDLPQGRSLNIESIYIENIEGERFKFNGSLTAARAMARHVSEGGATYDDIGKHITGLNEELGKLRHFKNYVQRHGALSENFSDLTTRVLTRIEDIKSELHSLQRESGYTAYKDQFQPYQSKDVPEDLMNDWVDKLTLRSFNEELKDVFPYLYNLVEAPIEDIEFEDIVSEENVVVPSDNKEGTLPESDEFESAINSITPEHEVVEFDPYEGNEFALKVRQLKAKGATPGTTFTTSDGEEHTLADAMERAGLAIEDFFSEQGPEWQSVMVQQVGKEGIEEAEDQIAKSKEKVLPDTGNPAKDVKEFVESFFDKETGKFPKGETGVMVAVDKKFGEGAVPVAKKVIEILKVKSEQMRIRELAGMVKKY